MKKFKGGLYADLSNYNTSLPNTEILLNFFKSNPVGYRSGGVVRGIAGGNPTGMKVTGGFLANAQNFRVGKRVKKKDDTVSAYYKDPDEFGVLYDQPTATERVWSGVTPYEEDPRFTGSKWVGKSGMPISDPTLYESKGLIGADLNLDEGAPERLKSAMDQKVKFLQQKGKTPPIDNSTGEPYTSWEAVPHFMIHAMHNEAIEELPKDTPDSDKQVTLPEISQEQKDREEGITGVSQEELKKLKKKAKDNLGFIDVNEVIENTKKENEELSSATQATKLKREGEGPSTFEGGKSTVETMEEEGLLEQPPSAEDIYKKTFTNNTEFQELIKGYKDASEADKAALKKIGEDYYGKKGGDAPAWSMPLMMMGLQMAASDNPSLLGAMGEGGIKGLEEYARQQKEKREDAKDKVKLDMDKATKLIEINSRDLNFAKDLATIKTNSLNQAMQIASNEKINFNNNLRAAIEADADRELKEWEIQEKMKLNWESLDAQYDFKNSDIEMQMIELLDKKEARKDDLDYKKSVLKLEVLKTNNDWQKHLNLVDLEKVSTGKTTSIMMPDSDGNLKETKIHVFLNKESGEFETKVLGFAPPDQDFIDDLTNQIRDQITSSKTVTIDGKEYDISGLLEKGDMLAIEDLVSQKVQKEINAKFATKKDIENILDQEG